MYELTVESQFDAAHNLRGYDGSCENLHGHTYRVQVFLIGSQLNNLGFVVDFKILKGVLAEAISHFDHHYLNELPEFQDVNPTAEHVARLIFEKMRASVGEIVSKVQVWETPTSSAAYYPDASPQVPK